MSKIVLALKDEIRRLARKEIREMVGSTKRAVAQYRLEIAGLKRQLGAQEKNVQQLKRRLAEQQPGAEVEEEPTAAVRFSARSVRAQRKRLRLSAADFGRLVGVSGLTVYNWESGRSRPRKAQFDALVAIRGIGKREARQRLQALAAAAKKRRP